MPCLLDQKRLNNCGWYRVRSLFKIEYENILIRLLVESDTLNGEFGGSSDWLIFWIHLTTRLSNQQMKGVAKGLQGQGNTFRQDLTNTNLVVPAKLKGQDRGNIWCLRVPRGC